MADTGKMHCRTCAQRVTATLNVSATKALSSVVYKGHTGRDAAGKKTRCAGALVRFDDQDFPDWAKTALGKHLDGQGNA